MYAPWSAAPYGLFLGSANPFFGLNVYKGANSTPDILATAGVLSGSANAVQPNPPQHVQVEGAPGGVLLSWDAPSERGPAIPCFPPVV